jgi:hypothetical protein
MRHALLPKHLAVEVERDETVVAERRDHALAVARRRRERRTAVRVIVLRVRRPFELRGPEHLPVATIDREDDVVLVLEARHEDVIADDARRRGSRRELRLPQEILVGPELRGNRRVAGDGETTGSAELRPVTVLRDGGSDEEERGEGDGSEHGWRSD